MSRYDDIINGSAAPPKGKAGAVSADATYTAELAKQRAYIAAKRARLAAIDRAIAPNNGYPGMRRLDAAGGQVLGSWQDEAIGKLAARGNDVANFFRSRRGEPTVSSDAIYRANRQAVDEETAQNRKDFPASTTGATIGGWIGGERLIGGLLAGVEPVAAMTAAAKNSGLATSTALRLKRAGDAVRPVVGDIAGKLAKATVTGGVGGAVQGAGEGTGSDRLGNLMTGAKYGALTGLGLEGALSFGVPLVSKVGADVYRAGKGLLLKDKPAGLISDADIEAARQKAYDIAQRNNLNSSNYKAAAAPYDDAMAGQVLGPEGTNLTGSLARRGGQTGTSVRATVWQRAKDRPASIIDKAETTLGVSPAAAAGDIKAMVQAGRAKIAPMYAALEESPHGVTSPALEHLLKSDPAKSLIRFEEGRAQLDQENPYGLTYAPVEVPPTGQAVNPIDAPSVGSPMIKPSDKPPVIPPPADVKVPRGPADPPSRGKPFLQWLAEQGGVAGEKGEMADMDLSKLGARSKNAGSAGVVDNDLNLRAQTAGYFPPGDPPTPDEFMQAIRDNNSGRISYPREADPAEQMRYDARQSALDQNRVQADQHAQTQADAEAAFNAERERQASEHADWQAGAGEYGEQDLWRGLEPPGGEGPPPGYETGSEAPQYEPGMTEAPTAKSLIRLHQAAGEDVKWKNGRLAPGRKNRMKNDFRRKLGAILAGDENGANALIPGYRDTLDEASIHPRAQGAYDAFSGKLFGGKMSAWQDAVDGIKSSDPATATAEGYDVFGHEGAKAAMANDLAEAFSSGQLRGGKFLPPGVKVKLADMFGADKASSMVDQMHAAAEQAAAEARMAPYSNSSSAAMLNAGAETDAARPGFDPAEVAGSVATHGLWGAIKGAGKAALDYGPTAGSSVGYRDMLGHIMQMTPDSFTAFLQHMEATGVPARNPDFARELGQFAGVAMRPVAQPPTDDPAYDPSQYQYSGYGGR